MALKLLRGVFFDVGGTLIFPNADRIRSMFLRWSKLAPSVETWVSAIHRASADLDLYVLNGGSFLDKWWDEYFSLVIKHAGSEKALNSEDKSRFLEALLTDHLQKNLWDSIIPEARATVEFFRAHGVRVGVISNSDGRVQQQLENSGLADLFEFIIDSQVVGVEKPDVRIFEMGLGRVELDSQDVLYVGDFICIDHEGATKAGMPAVIIDPLKLRREYQQASMVDSLKDVPIWAESRFSFPR